MLAGTQLVGLEVHARAIVPGTALSAIDNLVEPVGQRTEQAVAAAFVGVGLLTNAEVFLLCGLLSQQYLPLLQRHAGRAYEVGQPNRLRRLSAALFSGSFVPFLCHGTVFCEQAFACKKSRLSQYVVCC